RQGPLLLPLYLTEQPVLRVPEVLLSGQLVIVTCQAPGSCSGTPPQITWTGGFDYTARNVSLALMNGSISYSSELSFTPAPGDDGKELVCMVTYPSVVGVFTLTPSSPSGGAGLLGSIPGSGRGVGCSGRGGPRTRTPGFCTRALGCQEASPPPSHPMSCCRPTKAAAVGELHEVGQQAWGSGHVSLHSQGEPPAPP
uniref:Ig-like domain-containing protein n=1 Tax=Gopherus evgoodei TaxID=1825980 RepID=A0A8C4WRN4_9SAUR